MRITIVGGGVFGLSAAAECASRGHRVTLLEADSLPAAKAASHDVSKALRHVYGDKSALYAPLAAEAIGRWRALERETGRTLLHQTGFVALASTFADGGFEHASARALARLAIPHEVIEGRDLSARFPWFDGAGIAAALLDTGGGWLEPDECVLALRDVAVRRGATIRERSPVRDVLDPALRRDADAVLVAGGAWLSRLLPDLAPSIAPTLQHEWFFRPRVPPRAPPIAAVWSCDIATLGFYGFPAPPRGAGRLDLYKVASHSPGTLSDPDLERAPDAADRATTEAFVARRLPGLDPVAAEHRGCFYANTLDGHFLFDRLDGAPVGGNVFVAGGGSGHAFKFAPLLGRFAADRIEGKPVPAEFGLDRRVGRTV